MDPPFPGLQFLWVGFQPSIYMGLWHGFTNINHDQCQVMWETQ